MAFKLKTFELCWPWKSKPIYLFCFFTFHMLVHNRACKWATFYSSVWLAFMIKQHSSKSSEISVNISVWPGNMFMLLSNSILVLTSGWRIVGDINLWAKIRKPGPDILLLCSRLEVSVTSLTRNYSSSEIWLWKWFIHIKDCYSVSADSQSV